jgi:CRP-like cAMP-binding protein
LSLGEAAAYDKSAITRVLSQCALLNGLSDNEVAEVAELAHARAFAPQADIFAEGEPCTALWILASGRVRLYHSAADGRQQVVSFRSPVVALELGPALDGRAFTATATALDDVVMVILPRSTLITIERRFPTTVRNVIDQLCMELRQRDISTAVASLKDARGRIGCALLQLAYQYGTPSGSGVRIAYRLTRQDVADISGVTLETAIRALSEMQRQGIIRTQAQIIEIVDMKGLRGPTQCDECQFDCSVFVPARRNGTH